MDVRKKTQGSALIEAIAAMSIMAVVLGTGFSLYAKVLQSQKAVLKARASAEFINAWASTYGAGHVIPAQTNEFYSVGVQSVKFDRAENLSVQQVYVSDNAGIKVKEIQWLVIP